MYSQLENFQPCFYLNQFNFIFNKIRCLKAYGKTLKAMIKLKELQRKYLPLFASNFTKKKEY